MSDDDNDALLARARANNFRDLSPQDCHDLFAYHANELLWVDYERLRDSWKRDDMTLDVPAVATTALGGSGTVA